MIGGFINSYLDWRWSFWVLVIWAAVNWLLIFLFVPETYAPVLLRRKARKLRNDTGDGRWKAPIEVMNKSVGKTVAWSCIRPFQLLFLEPMCLNLCILSAILLGVLYLFFGVSILNGTQVECGTKLVSRPSPSYSKTIMGSIYGRLASPSLASLWDKR